MKRPAVQLALILLALGIMAAIWSYPFIAGILNR